MNLSDSLLIQKVREGDHYAFKKMFDLYSIKLCRLAYSITKDKQAAEDIIQDFFITYWLKRKTLIFNPTFLSYAYRAVYNSSLNYLRDTKKEIYSLSDEIEILYEDDSVQGEREELEVKLKEAIGQLPPRCKEIFLMAKINKKSYAEIASDLNLSENTIKAQVSKAYKIIKESLGLLFILSYININ